MSTIIIEPEWCNCDKCWEVFSRQFDVSKPSVADFVVKIRERWKGVPITIHQEREQNGT